MYAKLVQAGRARRHLAELAAAGVGRRAVAAAADISPSTVSEILSGYQRWLRASVEQRILDVTAEAAADHAKIPADATHAMIGELVRRGYSKSELARMLGLKSPKLGFDARSKVTAKTELAVKRLYRRLADRDPAPRGFCSCARPLELERDGAMLCGRCERPVREKKAG